MLCSTQTFVVEGATRALKLVLQSDGVSSAPLLESAPLTCLISLLSSSNLALAQTSCDVLTKCCSPSHQCATITTQGAVQPLIALALSGHRGGSSGTILHSGSQAAALHTLSLLLLHATVAVTQLLQSQPCPLRQLHLLLRSRTPRVKLYAASCISCVGVGDVMRAPDGAAGMVQAHSQAQSHALPVLLKLLGDSDLCGEVPAVLARLLEDNVNLRRAASDAGAVKILAGFLAGGHTYPGVREASLGALASICLTQDDARKQLIEAKALIHIIAALSDSSSGVRCAATMCIMALTRSVKALRTNLLDPNIAGLLCILLEDDSPAVQLHAAAAVCNLVLEFSAVKDAVLSNGGMKRLVALTSSELPALRLHSTWALRNMVYKSEPSIRAALMQELTWPMMQRLLTDVDEPVVEQAVCILRNLCMETPSNITAALAWAGPELLVVLEEKLDPSRHSSHMVKLHALYTTVNILSGSEAHKDAVLNGNLPSLLLHHLRAPASPTPLTTAPPPPPHTLPPLRDTPHILGLTTIPEPEDVLVLPAVWCVINLTWPDVGGSGAVRARKLRELGMEEGLRGLAGHASADVRERVRTALEQLSSS
ncbi:MAG: hypothetical protein WDW38_002971 [Sanguina aurantia]